MDPREIVACLCGDRHDPGNGRCVTCHVSPMVSDPMRLSELVKWGAQSLVCTQVCCDGCFCWAHLPCLGLEETDIPLGSFFCASCAPLAKTLQSTDDRIAAASAAPPRSLPLIIPMNLPQRALTLRAAAPELAGGLRSKVLSHLVRQEPHTPGGPSKGKTVSDPQLVFALPTDALLHVLSFLEMAELAVAGAACRAWRSLAASPRAWRKIDLSRPLPAPAAASGLHRAYADVADDALLADFLAPRAALAAALDCSYCTLFSEAGLRAVVSAAATTLESLILRFCVQLGDEALLSERGCATAGGRPSPGRRGLAEESRSPRWRGEWTGLPSLPSMEAGTKRRRAMLLRQESRSTVAAASGEELSDSDSAQPTLQLPTVAEPPPTSLPPQLRPLLHCARLVLLDFYGCSGITLSSDSTLVALSASLPSLAVLDLRQSGVPWRRAASIVTVAALSQWAATVPAQRRADAVAAVRGLAASERALLTQGAGRDGFGNLAERGSPVSASPFLSLFPNLTLLLASLPVHSVWLSAAAERGEVLQSSSVLFPGGCFQASTCGALEGPLDGVVAVARALAGAGWVDDADPALVLPAWGRHPSRDAGEPSLRRLGLWSEWLSAAPASSGAGALAEVFDASSVFPNEPLLLLGQSLRRVEAAARRVAGGAAWGDAASPPAAFRPLLLAQWPDDRSPPNADDLRAMGVSFAIPSPPLPAELLAGTEDGGGRVVRGLRAGNSAVIRCLAASASTADGAGEAAPCKCCLRPPGTGGSGCVWRVAAAAEPAAARALRDEAAVLAEEVTGVRAARAALDESLALHPDPLVHLYASWLADVSYEWAAARRHCAAALALVPECGTAAAFVAGSLLQAGSTTGGGAAQAAAVPPASPGFADTVDGWLDRAEASAAFLPGTYHLLWEQRGVARLREGRFAEAADCLRVALHFAPPIVDRGDESVARALRTTVVRLRLQRVREREARRRASTAAAGAGSHERDGGASHARRLVGASARSPALVARAASWRPIPRQPNEQWA